MPAISTTNATRYFSITDEGDEFEVQFYVSGQQVGGACFPFVMGEDFAHELALSVGNAFIASPPPPC